MITPANDENNRFILGASIDVRFRFESTTAKAYKYLTASAAGRTAEIMIEEQFRREFTY